MPPFSNLEDRRGGKSLTVKPIQTSHALEGSRLLMHMSRQVRKTSKKGRSTIMRKGLCFAQCCAAARRKAAPLLGLLVYTLGFGLSANAQGGTIITFDAPGAVNGTEALAMNPAGSITGFYFDANFVPHGFLRAKNGSFTTFDAPGAGLQLGLEQGTYATSINPGGAITGF